MGTRLGFEQARVRQHGEIVRIEIACHDLHRALMPDLSITALHTSSICTNRAMTCKRQGKHTIDRFNPQWVCAFTTMDGMPTVSASLRIGLGAKWKNSEGARQVPLPNGMTLAGT